MLREKKLGCNSIKPSIIKERQGNGKLQFYIKWNAYTVDN